MKASFRSPWAKMKLIELLQQLLCLSILEMRSLYFIFNLPYRYKLHDSISLFLFQRLLARAVANQGRFHTESRKFQLSKKMKCRMTLSRAIPFSHSKHQKRRKGNRLFDLWWWTMQYESNCLLTWLLNALHAIHDTPGWDNFTAYLYKTRAFLKMWYKIFTRLSQCAS